MITVTEKYCPCCERMIQQPYLRFFRHPRKKDGLQPTCKVCQRENNRRYKEEQRKKNPRLRYGIKGKELDELVALQVQHLQEFIT